ncbi:MAG TPA: histidinol dehydrogenase [Chloroflexota bacterium]|jgi:histidinol dehydrogenase|nr:histidinol dehydrogenase [Chloroflexota bacterium]
MAHVRFHVIDHDLKVMTVDKSLSLVTESALITVFEDGEPADGLRAREKRDTAGVELAVGRILGDVRLNGDEALSRLTERFDGVYIEEFAVTDQEIEAAYDAVEPAFLDALRAAMAAVRTFHESQLRSEQAIQTVPGVSLRRLWRPIERVGLYVPGGRATYPSSVMMLGIPALVAGCPERVLVSPPGTDGRMPAETVVAAAEVEVTELYKVGGAQAIAALAFGTESIAPVDKICGPGNAYVTAAKTMIWPEVAIDFPAGPSELMIVADDSAPPPWIAADMLANAEHGPDSRVILISTSGEMVTEVLTELETQLQALPKKDIAAGALREFGAVVLVSDVAEAIDIVNDYAPEHLELMVGDVEGALALVINAGSVFLGSLSANAAGDYATGTNHVLPTAGFARVHGALSVEAFGRSMEVQELDSTGVHQLTEAVTRLARTEGFEGHARAMEIRSGPGIGRR